MNTILGSLNTLHQHFSVGLILYMMWAKRMSTTDKHWQVGICLSLPQPVTLPMKIQGWSHVMVTRPSDETGTDSPHR